MEIVIASKNRHKIEEISERLKTLGIESLSLLDFEVTEAPETGSTFLENVYQKSSFYAERLN
uniref:non-canonical purine NTP pyrophosphatase n=1 Tax=Desulfurobacterium sp. TaxID=2004706 RepID=UPI002610CC86